MILIILRDILICSVILVCICRGLASSGTIVIIVARLPYYHNRDEIFK